jgi:hypothetical protein
VKRIWNREHFKPSGQITEQMAKRHLRIGANEMIVKSMIKRLEDEQTKVGGLIVEEIGSLLRLGADVTGLTYNDKSTGGQRKCVTTKDMRSSYIEDGTAMNIKCIHWIFHELPYATHKDVLVQRKSHMDWVVEKVEIAMNVQWEPMKQGEKKGHKNCMEHMYARVLSKKRNNLLTNVADKDGLHRKPIVKSPKSMEAALYTPKYTRGKRLFYWKSKAEGEHVVLGLDNEVYGKTVIVRLTNRKHHLLKRLIMTMMRIGIGGSMWGRVEYSGE